MKHNFSCTQERITYPDGAWANISLLKADQSALRFADLLHPDHQVRLRDAARLRYFKARIRGEEAPLVIAWACLETDRPVHRMFPTLPANSEQGEHFISTNSFITYVLRTLVQRGWLRFGSGEWYTDIPPGYPAWEEASVIILHWLIAEGRLWLETGPDHPLPEITRFEGCDPLLHVTPVGRSGFVRDYARTRLPAAVFNTSFFLLEHDDYLSHHSALGDPYGLTVIDGTIVRPALYRRATLWQDAAGRWQISSLGMDAMCLELPGGLTLLPPGSQQEGPQFAVNPADNVPLAIYTRYFGAAHGTPPGHTPSSPGRFEITIVDRRVVSWKRGGGLMIPQNGYVLSAAATRLGQPLTELGDLEPVIAALRELLQHGELRYRFDSPQLQGMTWAQQNGPALVQDGAITIEDASFEQEEYWLSRATPDGYQFGIVPTEFPTDAAATRAARIGAGIDTDGNLLVLAISGSSKGIARPGVDSAGATLRELAEQLVAAGAVQGINFDGGGSVQVFVEGGLYNDPGDRRGRQGVIYERMVPTVGIID